MAKAKVFRSGNSQAVGLPKQFRFRSKEVEISREGDKVILRERPQTLGRAFELLAALPEDFSVEPRSRRPQKRPGL